MKWKNTMKKKIKIIFAIVFFKPTIIQELIEIKLDHQIKKIKKHTSFTLLLKK